MLEVFARKRDIARKRRLYKIACLALLIVLVVSGIVALVVWQFPSKFRSLGFSTEGSVQNKTPATKKVASVSNEDAKTSEDDNHKSYTHKSKKKIKIDDSKTRESEKESVNGKFHSIKTHTVIHFPISDDKDNKKKEKGGENKGEENKEEDNKEEENKEVVEELLKESETLGGGEKGRQFAEKYPCGIIEGTSHDGTDDGEIIKARFSLWKYRLIKEEKRHQKRREEMQQRRDEYFAEGHYDTYEEHDEFFDEEMLTNEEIEKYEAEVNDKHDSSTHTHSDSESSAESKSESPPESDGSKIKIKRRKSAEEMKTIVDEHNNPSSNTELENIYNITGKIDTMKRRLTGKKNKNKKKNNDELEEDSVEHKEDRHKKKKDKKKRRKRRQKNESHHNNDHHREGGRVKNDKVTHVGSNHYKIPLPKDAPYFFAEESAEFLKNNKGVLKYVHRQLAMYDDLYVLKQDWNSTPPRAVEPCTNAFGRFCGRRVQNHPDELAPDTTILFPFEVMESFDDLNQCRYPTWYETSYDNTIPLHERMSTIVTCLLQICKDDKYIDMDMYTLIHAVDQMFFFFRMPVDEVTDLPLKAVLLANAYKNGVSLGFQLDLVKNNDHGQPLMIKITPKDMHLPLILQHSNIPYATKQNKENSKSAYVDHVVQALARWDYYIGEDVLNPDTVEIPDEEYYSTLRERATKLYQFEYDISHAGRPDKEPDTWKSNVKHMDKDCSKPMWAQLFSNLEDIALNQIHIVTPVMVEGFYYFRFCHIIINTPVDVLWDFYLIGQIKILGNYSSTNWFALSHKLRYGEVSDLYYTRSDRCDHEVANAFPWVVASQTSSEFEEYIYGPGYQFQNVAMGLIKDAAEELLEEQTSDVSIRNRFLEKIEDMTIGNGKINWMTDDDIAETYLLAYSNFKGVYKNIFHSYGVLMGKSEGFKQISSMAVSAHEHVTLGVLRNDKLNSIDQQFASYNTLDNNVVYNPHRNSLFIPLALLYKGRNISNKDDDDCERAYDIVDYATLVGRRIVRGIIDGIASPYDADGMEWRDIPQPFRKELEETHLNFYQGTVFYDDGYKQELSPKASLHRRYLDILELHFTYFATMKSIYDMKLKVDHCADDLESLFYHAYARHHCEAYSFDETVRIMQNDPEYVPPEVRLNHSYVAFPPFREHYECPAETELQAEEAIPVKISEHVTEDKKEEITHL
eukprot:GHVR01049053.1.p1 GENE.GHVR01049053.1~~GHVR01049053.1.p1  ORF type:complete len:1193 (-),score=241.90 GHVR01049053.1:1015-4593(-)